MGNENVNDKFVIEVFVNCFSKTYKNIENYFTEITKEEFYKLSDAVKCHDRKYIYDFLISDKHYIKILIANMQLTFNNRTLDSLNYVFTPSMIENFDMNYRPIFSGWDPICGAKSGGYFEVASKNMNLSMHLIEMTQDRFDYLSTCKRVFTLKQLNEANLIKAKKGHF